MKVITLEGDGIGHCQKGKFVGICVILGGYRGKDIGISRLLSVRFVFVSGEKDVYEMKVYTEQELLPYSLDAAVVIKIREDKLRRATGELRRGFPKFIEVEVGIFQYLL